MAPEIIPVDGDGVVRLDALEEMLADCDEPALVSVMLANNETGVLQPVAEVAAIARRHGALVHCDAVQAAGKIAVDVAALGVHLLSLSAHKLGGPAGVGALVVDPSVPLSPLLRGGGQERGRRAGTENVLGIVGFGAAAEAVLGCDDSARLAALRDRLERRLKAICPSVRLFGAAAPRLPNTIVHRNAGRERRDAGDRLRPRLRLRERRSGLLVGQGHAQPRADGDGRWRGYCGERRPGEPGLDHDGGGRGAIYRGLDRHLRPRAGASGSFGAGGGRGGPLTVSER